MKMGLFLAIIIGLSAGLLFWIIIEYVLHRNVTKRSFDRYGKANFKRFKEEFEKFDWYYNPKSDKLYGKSGEYESKIYSDTYEFNDKGMLISNPIEFFRVKYFLRRYIRDKKEEGDFRSNYVKDLWQE